MKLERINDLPRTGHEMLGAVPLTVTAFSAAVAGYVFYVEGLDAARTPGAVFLCCLALYVLYKGVMNDARKQREIREEQQREFISRAHRSQERTPGLTDEERTYVRQELARARKGTSSNSSA